MTRNLNITLAQLNPVVGDLQGNTRKILETWKNAPKETDLILLPELALSGYPPEDLVLKPAFLDEIENCINHIVEQSKKYKSALLLTTPYRAPQHADKIHEDIPNEEQVHNAALLIQNGEITARIFKHHLPNYGVFDEQRVFISGPLPSPVEFKGFKLGISICEDLWHGDVEHHLKKQGADILILPNGSPFTADKHHMRVHHMRTLTKSVSLPLIYVNQTGGQDELVFDGGSFVMSAGGEIVTQMKFFEEDTAEISYPNLPSEIKENNLSQNENIYNALTLGLHDYITKNNFPGVLIGLSGGVDSALAAAIATDTLGPDKVRCIMMPSPFTSEDSLEDARKCAEALGVSYETMPIDQAMQSFTTIIPGLDGIAHENMQSRVRGLILMALSNASGYMVLSTGNKSEMAVGYATLYGDMCGGFNPLKDVYKTQVYELCAWRNAQSPVIPQRILTKAPTAELKDNQTDQDSLPPYEDLDKILHAAIENEKSAAEITAMGFDNKIVEKTLRMIGRAEYKRRQAPPGVKITTRAFGRDRRYPMTNGFL